MLTITSMNFNINLLCEKFYAYQLGKQSYFKVALIFFFIPPKRVFFFFFFGWFGFFGHSEQQWDLSSLVRD